MTQPTPEATAEETRRPRSARPKRGQVVEYSHDDPILGGTVTGVGVVLGEGTDGPLQVARVELSYLIDVDPARASVLEA